MKQRHSGRANEPLPPLPEEYRQRLNRVTYPREAPEDDELRLGAMLAALLLLVTGSILVVYGIFEGNSLELVGGAAVIAVFAVNAAASEWWRRDDLEGPQRVFADLPIWICAVLAGVITVATFIGLGWAAYEIATDPVGRRFVLLGVGLVVAMSMVGALLSVKVRFVDRVDEDIRHGDGRRTRSR